MPFDQTHVTVGDRVVTFELVPCGNCGGKNEKPVVEGPDRFLGLPGRFRLVRCTDCGLIRQNPRPSADCIDAYYPASYEPFSSIIGEERSLLRRWDRRYGMYKRRRLIEQYHREGRILDVGCATGNFLGEMARTGRWLTVGVEPNQGAASVAQGRLGLDVRVGRLNDVELETESFDVITLWNVLEHLHEPIADLRLIERLLRPGGALIFSLPNVESFEVRVFQERWFGWELPRHLYFFPRSVLGDILRSLGLRLVESRCLSGSQISFGASLRYMLPASPAQSPWARHAANIFSSPAGRIFMFLPFYLLDLLGQGMIVTHVAIKG